MRIAGHDTPALPSFLVKNQKHTRQPRPPERAWFRASAAQQHCQLSCAQLFACFFFFALGLQVSEKKKKCIFEVQFYWATTYLCLYASGQHFFF
jgi:hypothetical protein